MLFQKGHKINNGRHRSEEIKKKISDGLKGLNTWTEGVPRSEEVKEKIRNTLKGRKRPPMSEEWRNKISESLKGKIGINSRNWKGGLTPLALKIRHNFKSRQWISDVFTRDDFTCQECGQRGGNIEAHHIKSFSSILQYYEITTLEEALECEELWNINNGVTLCVECHKKAYSGVLINA